MNLYRISQTKNNDWDTYDSAIVAAETEDQAKWIHPSKFHTEWDGKQESYGTWCDVEDVSVELIGTTHLPKGVVLASYNAG